MGNQHQTKNNFKNRINSIVGSDYTFKDEYVNVKTKLLCRHNVCGHEWYVSPNNFIFNNTRCPPCGNLHRKTNEEFVNEVFNLVGNEYLFSEPYVNTKHPIKCTHEICGHEWKIAPQNFIKMGNRCPKCAGQVITNEEFKNRVIAKTGDEYIFIDEYSNMVTDLKCLHTSCGQTFLLSPTNFLYNDTRCSFCTTYNKSYKEDFISKVLDTMNVEYIREKRFDECKNKKTLPFDFYFSINGSHYCIEYDGIQHFQAIEAWGGIDRLINQQNIDKIKDDFCKNNNIELLRVNYLDSDVSIVEKIKLFINCSTTIP